MLTYDCIFIVDRSVTMEMSSKKTENGVGEDVVATATDEEELPPDQIISNIGEFGRWQRNVFLLSCVIQLSTAFPGLSITFLSANTDFWCTPPDEYADMDVEKWRNFSSPLIEQGGTMKRDQCNVWNTSDYSQPSDNATRACDDWTYNRTTYTNTVIQEFDLVCGQEAIKNTAQSVFFGGVLFGVLAAGYTSDRFGRRKSLIPIAIAMAATGAITAAMPSIETFLVLRFLQGLTATAFYTVHFVLCMEIIGGKWQTIIGISFVYPWVISWFLLALAAYFVSNWRYLLLVLYLPAIGLHLLCFLLPESPKWLLVNGRVDEAEKIVRKAVKKNGKKTLADDWHLHSVVKEDTSSKGNILDLFKTSNMAKKTLILYINWFANSFVYYGLTLNSSNLGGTIMINFLIGGLTEIPAYTFSLFILLKRGRKLPYAAMMILGGIFLLCTVIIPRDAFAYNWPIVLMAMLGKLCITGKYKKCPNSVSSFNHLEFPL